jgi:hypothetical protein
LRFEVKDSGIGMREDEKNRIFKVLKGNSMIQSFKDDWFPQSLDSS